MAPELDPTVSMILAGASGGDRPPLWELEPVEARALTEQSIPLLEPFAPAAHLASVADRDVAGSEATFRVRVYTPHGDGPHGGVVYLHGGGYVICSIETHDKICRSLAERSGSVVVSVDYRLAPEHPWPAGVTDCYDALCWTAEHAAQLGIDPGRLVVAGDSAGGNFAAVCAQLARDRGGPALAAQVLIYPGTDRVGPHDSLTAFGEGYLLEAQMREWFARHYVPDGADLADPTLSPLRAASHADLATALVITAEFDPLRDEGEAYGRALAAAGVPTTTTRYLGMIHGFLSYFGLVPAAEVAIDQIAGFLSSHGRHA